MNAKLLSLFFPIIISITCWYFYCKYTVKSDFIYNGASQEGYTWISNIHKNIINPTFHGTLFWEITFLVLPVSFYVFFVFVQSNESKFNKYFIISFFVTVFIFSNLYLVHDYYIYGSGLLILFYLSEKITNILNKKGLLIKYLLVFTLVTIGCLNYLHNGYFNFQKKRHKYSS